MLISQLAPIRIIPHKDVYYKETVYEKRIKKN